MGFIECTWRLVCARAAWSSFLTWTCYNTIFLISVVHGHYGNPWNRPSGALGCPQLLILYQRQYLKQE